MRETEPVFPGAGQFFLELEIWSFPGAWMLKLGVSSRQKAPSSSNISG